MPIFGFLSTGTFALAIPVIAIIGGIAIGIVGIIMGARKKELQHKERIIAMEKGLDLPAAEPPRRDRRQHDGNRTGGLVLLGFGVAFTIALWVSAGAEGGVWGLLPLGIGAGLLIASNLERKEKNQNGGPDTTP